MISNFKLLQNCRNLSVMYRTSTSESSKLWMRQYCEDAAMKVYYYDITKAWDFLRSLNIDYLI